MKTSPLVHGGWGPYSDWSSCPVTCNGGVQTRTRKCDQPKPMFGGNMCVGEALETRKCGTAPCPGEKVLLIYTLMIME